MRVEKKTLNDALRVLGKVVCQTSPVELYRSVRFVVDGDGVYTMATDGVETVSAAVEAFTETEIDSCVPFKELKDLVRMGVRKLLICLESLLSFRIWKSRAKILFQLYFR